MTRQKDAVARAPYGPVQFIRTLVLAAVKQRLMRRARYAVEIFGSAFSYQPVLLPLLSPLERWAAHSMQRDGLAVVSGNTVEIGIYTTSAARVAPVRDGPAHGQSFAHGLIK